MTYRDEPPPEIPNCPECITNDAADHATDREREAFSKPYWCARCSLAYSGSQIEAQHVAAAKAAAAAERGELGQHKAAGVDRGVIHPKEQR